MRKIEGKRPILRKTGQNTQTVRKAATRHEPRPYTPNPDSQYLTPTEIKAVFNVITSPRDRAIFRLIYHRGLRASEPGLLQLSDWNEREGLLYVRRGKNSISQDYPLLAIETAALRAWVKIRGRDAGPLFTSQKGPRKEGFGIHRSQLFDLFRRYCKAAGIRTEKAHLHALKHSCGTHLSENGESAEDIKDWLGHRAASSTAIYLHYTQRRRMQAAQRQRNWR